MNSVWNESVHIEGRNKLVGDRKTDVLIIGGGLAGILTAYMLAEKGVPYILVEAAKIGMGITKNTTAKITSQHGLIYDKLIKNAGVEKAKQYLMANELAIKKFRELSEKIDCDFEEKDAYVYSLDDKEKIEKEVRALKTLGVTAEFVSKIPLPLQIAGAIKFKGQAQFNPLKLIDGISKNLNIYEDTFVASVKGNVAFTKRGKIIANKIIVATHFPFIDSYGGYFLKMYQHRSYVIAIENATDINGMVVDEKDNGLSFRNYQNLLLVGGGDHKTGKRGGGYEESRRFIKATFPNAIEKYLWATQDCMTLDRVPYIGLYSKNAPNLYVATGFNKWGMTSSMVAAMILSDLVRGRENEFCSVFEPDRSILKGQLFANAFDTAINFFSFKTKRCTHLGCALQYNKLEHTWDCPCHGSRFDQKGNIIDNPATKKLKI